MRTSMTIKLTKDEKTTVDNLRKLADVATEFNAAVAAGACTVGFDMSHFYAVEGLTLSRYAVPYDKPECSSTCCLIGIANLAGMGADIDARMYGSDSSHSKVNWITYSEKLFPVLAEEYWEDGEEWIDEYGLSKWDILFGDHLESNLPHRIDDLRAAADNLEAGRDVTCDLGTLVAL